MNVTESNRMLYDSDIERSLVKMFLSGVNNEYFSRCATMLAHDDFEDEWCRDVWSVMEQLGDERSSVDAASVAVKAPQMGVGLDAAKLIEVASEASYGYPMEVAAYLSDLSTRRRLQRRLMSLCVQLNDVDRPVEDVLGKARKAVDETAQGGTADVTNNDIYIETVNEWQRRMNGQSTYGIPCGFHYIDRRGGLQPGDLDIISGRTSMGKTSLAIAMLLNAAKSGVACGVISLEMSLKQLFMRMTAMESGVSATKLQYSQLDEVTFQIAFSGASGIAQLPIYYDGTRSSNVRHIEATIRRMRLNYQAKLFVIDYAQLLTDPKAKDERTRIGGAANSLKALAVELDVCIILISQIRRLKPGDSPVPTISMLKESGDLENAADNIYLIYRAGIYNMQYPDMSGKWSRYDTTGTALIINGKSRNNGIGEFLLGFDADITLYHELTTPPIASVAPAAMEESPF